MAAIANRVIVLYAGQIVEDGSVLDVLTKPVHPYTRGLLASVPDFRSETASGAREIPGLPPNQTKLEAGCRFADRCTYVEPACRVRRPKLQTISVDATPHRVACPVVISAEGLIVHD